jgi:ABC-type transport system involved in multi-copper enzyme maturation permease subunit
MVPKDGTEILVILAAILGGGLIAGEVSKGAIFFARSKPISRERLLLTKYGGGALVQLIVTALGSAALLVASAVVGHPQPVSRMLLATLLLWLGTLFVLGLATLLSVVCNDILRPVVLAIVITIAISIPGYFPNASAWSLPGYWSSQSAYLAGTFSAKALVICIIAAGVPLLIALPLFRSRAY